MAEIKGYLYTQTLMKALSKEIDFLNDEIKIMLCTNAYAPDQDNHAYLSDITNETTGTGYTAGGIVLTNKTMITNGDSLGNFAGIDATDVSWSNSSITARFAVIYDNTPSTNKPLLCWLDFGEDKASSSGTFTITFDSGGIIKLYV